MRIVAAYLADYAVNTGGPVHAIGAHPAALELPELPYRGTTHLVVVAELERAEATTPQPVTVSMRRTRDDAVLVDGSIDVSCEPAEVTRAGDWPLISTQVIPVQVVIDDVGRHRIELGRDGEVLWTIAFGIRLAIG